MRIATSTTIALFALALLSPAARAQTAPPKADVPGSADSALLKRYAGSTIVIFEKAGFDEFVLPLGKLEPAPKDAPAPLQPKSAKTVEGQRTHILYHVGKERSTLEVARNYEDELKAHGARVLYACKEEACGGSPSTNVQRGDAGLLNFLYPRKRAKESYGSPGYCAMDGSTDGIRYSAVELGGGRGFASIAVYATADQGGTCSAFKGATFVSVDVIETKAREQRMVAIKSGEMADAIDGGGKVALYGIYFDTDKATLKAESDATLEQIGKLMKEKPRLKLLVVGHTDNAGSFASNMELSQRRAAAVVGALTSRFDVKKDRLTPVGVSSAAPVASNKSDDGRAKNRRVELVEN